MYGSVDEVVSDVERDLGVPLRLEGEELKIGRLRYFINQIFGRKVKPRTQQRILQGEVYGSVYAENLTPEELSKSKLPEDSIVSIQVYFRSPNGKSYLAAHNWYSETERRPETSQILLSSIDRHKDDFKSMK